MSKQLIDPLQKHLLVELRSAYKHLGHTTEERYGTSKTRGIVIAIAPDIAEECKGMGIKVNDMVYFGKYEDTAPYQFDSSEFILIKLEEVGGRSDAN